MVQIRHPSKELKRFLSAYHSGVVELALAARERILEIAPGANEIIYDGYNAVAVAFSYSDRLRDAFCHVATYTKHVNLGFNHGAQLSDPKAILEGSGKSIRHIKLTTLDDLTGRYISNLICEAAKATEGRASGSREGRAFVKSVSANKRRPK